MHVSRRTDLKNAFCVERVETRRKRGFYNYNLPHKYYGNYCAHEKGPAKYTEPFVILCIFSDVSEQRSTGGYRTGIVLDRRRL